MGILCEQMHDAVVIDRAREEITLTILAAEHFQLLVLLLRFRYLSAMTSIPRLRARVEMVRTIALSLSVVNADPRDIIVAPVVSEKSYGELNRNWYTFLVHPDANKTQIKIAIQQIFNVRVLTVNTLNREGKRKRTRPAGASARTPSARWSSSPTVTGSRPSAARSAEG